MTRPASAAPDPLRYEREAWALGAARVCGIDEVGRGPLAGPVVACAVILPRDFHHASLTDSKKLTEKQREAIHAELTARADVQWSLASVDAPEIDRMDILRATWRAMESARDGLAPPPDWTLVDGLRVPVLGGSQTPIVKGDLLSLSIAAASVIAKVTRDRVMVAFHAQFPGYGFARHKGYGTKEHMAALEKLGPSPIHRRSFEPVRRAADRGLTE